MTSLMRAAGTGQTEILRLLLEYKADVNARGKWGGTALTEAASAYDERLDVVQLLLDHGADVNLAEEPGMTPLMHAVSRRRKAIAEALLAAGAAVNTTAGPTNALQIAASGNDLAFVRLLITHGADVNAQTIDGETALHCAKVRGHWIIVGLLKLAGAKR